MNAVAFDALAYARRLESAGFSRRQAEALAEEQARLLEDRPLMNPGIRETELRMEVKIAAVRTDLMKWAVATAVGMQTVVIVGAVTALLHLLVH